MASVIETGTLPAPVDQFAFWRETVCETLFGLWAERNDTSPFRARVEMHHMGGIQLAEAQFPPHRLGRGPAEISRVGQAAYCLQYLREGTVHGLYRGVEYHAKAGDLLLFDTSLSCDSFVVDQPLATIIVHLPQDLLTSRMGTSVHAPVRLCAREGTGALLAGYMSSLSQSVSTLPVTAMAKAGDVLCDLIATAFSSPIAIAENYRGGVREARLATAQRFIAANLRDPELGVRKIALHLGVSERYVHKLFTGTGRTFTETLLSARLEACEKALRTPHEDHRTIANIAFGYGFNDLSWFYRCYRSRWGETPRETRIRTRESSR